MTLGPREREQGEEVEEQLESTFKRRKTHYDDWGSVTKTYRKDKNRLTCFECETTFSLKTSTEVISSHVQGHWILLGKTRQKRLGNNETLTSNVSTMVPTSLAEQQKRL